MEDLVGRRKEVLRIAAIALTVGLFVTSAHRWLGNGMPRESWVIVHTLLPVMVFSLGARAAGTTRMSTALVLRGLVTVTVVSVAFSLVNGRLSLAPLSQLGLNVLVPAAVATAGALGGSRRAADPPGGSGKGG